MIFHISFWIISRIYLLLLRYVPTNWIVAFVRTRRGQKWGVPIGAVLVPAYTIAMMTCGEWYEAADNVWIAALGALMFWNALKFITLAIASVGLLVRARFREWRWRRAALRAIS